MEIQRIAMQTGSNAASVVLNGGARQQGDFLVVVGGSNTVGTTYTATPPLVLLDGTPGVNTGKFLAYQTAIASGTDTVTWSAAITRTRPGCWRGVVGIKDWNSSAGTGTSAVGLALNLAGDPDPVVYDFLYCETSGLTISGQDGAVISSSTSGASWMDSFHFPGAVSSYTPSTLTISGAGGPWVRISVALRN